MALHIYYIIYIWRVYYHMEQTDAALKSMRNNMAYIQASLADAENNSKKLADVTEKLEVAETFNTWLIEIMRNLHMAKKKCYMAAESLAVAERNQIKVNRTADMTGQLRVQSRAMLEAAQKENDAAILQHEKAEKQFTTDVIAWGDRTQLTTVVYKPDDSSSSDSY